MFLSSLLEGLQKNFTIFLANYPALLRGLAVTIYLTIITSIAGIILGTLLALGKVYGNKFISGIVTAFIGLIQGTPLLVQLFVVYYGLPVYGIRLTPIAAADRFTINSGAYQAEYLRGSIQSVSSGQLKAALSLGMTRWQGIFYVILPQA